MNTFIGGIVSLIIKFTLLTFFFANIVKVFDHGETLTATKQILKSYFDDTTQFKLTEDVFDIGLAYVSFSNLSVGENLLADPTYFNVTFSNTVYHRVETDESERRVNSIPLGICGDRFSKHDVNKYNKIDKYL